MMSAYFLVLLIYSPLVMSQPPHITPGRTSVGVKQLSSQLEPAIYNSNTPSNSRSNTHLNTHSNSHLKTHLSTHLNTHSNSKGSLTWNGGQILSSESNLESLKGRSETTIASTRCGNIIFIGFNSAQGFCVDNPPDDPQCPGVPDGFNNGMSHYSASLDAGKTWKYMYGPPVLGTDIYTGSDPWFSMGGKSSTREEILYFANLAVNKSNSGETLGIVVHVARIIYKDDDPHKKAIDYEWIGSSLIPSEIGDFMDKDAIAADPFDAHKAYVSLTLFDTGLKMDIQVYATHNAGESWKGPVVLQDGYEETHVVNHMTYPLVNANGEIYITWYEFLDTAEDFLSSLRFMFVRSTDGGKTFSEKIRINPAFIKFNPFYQPPISSSRDVWFVQPTMDVFTNKNNNKYLNRIFIAYSYAVEDEFDGELTGFIDDDSTVLNSINIGISYSDDKGKKWHFIDAFIDDIPKRFVKRIWPTVSVSSDGKSVNVAYLEINYIKKSELCEQNLQTRSSYYHDIVDTYYIHSNDGGTSWSDPIKLNDKSVDWCITGSNIDPNYGNYMLSISDLNGNLQLAGVTNGFTAFETSTQQSQLWTAVDVIYYNSKEMKKMCDIVIKESCVKTEDCCSGTIDEPENDITCSCYVKWNIIPLDKNNKFCCVKNMGKCYNDYQCCGRKTKCVAYRCYNAGQWRGKHRLLLNE